MASYQSLNITVPTSECIAACIVYLEGVHVNIERRYNDLIKIDYPLWFVELEYYEPVDENVVIVEMLMNMKENVKLGRRVDKEGGFAHMSIKDSHPNIFTHVAARIISFPSKWMVKSGLSAVVDVFSRKRDKLDPNSRGTVRPRLNNFIKIDYNMLC